MTTKTPASGVRKAVLLLKREFLELLPTLIYFLLGFNLIAFSMHLVLLEQGIVYDGITKAIVGAILVAKVVLVADRLSIVDLVRGRPLIGSVLYRSVLYTLLVLLADVIEVVVRKAIAAGGVSGGLAAARAELVWEHVLFVNIWVFTLFFVYFCESEVRREFNLPPIWRLLTARFER